MFKKITASQIVIDGKGDGDEYLIRTLDANGEKHEMEAGALNLNGFAFATSGMEIGEYNQTVTVEKENEWSRYVNIRVEAE